MKGPLLVSYPLCLGRLLDFPILCDLLVSYRHLIEALVNI